MDSNIRLDKQGKDEIRNMFNWLIKSKKNVNLPSSPTNVHCNNYATNCCLNCDKCWGSKYRKQK